MYAACAIIFLGLGGLALLPGAGHRDIRSRWSFCLRFALGFIAYSVIWSVLWFTFRDTFLKMMTGRKLPKTRSMDFQFGPSDAMERIQDL